MLSIVIVNWNTRDLLLDCLASIIQNPPAVPCEIIVVDNHSRDNSAEAVRSEFPGAKLIELSQNTGYARGNNLGFQVAQGEWVLTLNPDTEVQKNALQIALDTLQAHPEAGCVAVRLTGANGTPQKSVRGFPSFWGILGAVTGLDKVWPNGALGSYTLPNFDYEQEQVAPQPMGTFLLFRRLALASIGDPLNPFDERFPIFFNEVDLLYRLKQRGWSCFYSPRAIIKHRHGASTRQVKKSMIWESAKSLVRYFRKHGSWRLKFILPLLAFFVYTHAFIRAKGYHAGFRT